MLYVHSLLARFGLAHLVHKCPPRKLRHQSDSLIKGTSQQRALLVSMEDKAARAARLRSMREAAGLDTRQQDGDEAAPDTNTDDPVLKFRNYSVKDDKITHEKQAAANPPKYEQPVVEQDADVEGEELLLSVAPKKPNWDLRRDVEPKLAKLERRTQRAMITIMQNQQQNANQELT